MKGQDTTVSSVANHVPAYTGTTFHNVFVRKRLHSWQAHFHRICHYLKHGEWGWWSRGAQVYRFHDSDTDSDSHSECPTLNHFRHTSLPDVYRQNDEVLHDWIQSNTSLPTTKIRIYQQDGNCIGEKHYPLPNDSSTKMLYALLTNHPSDASLADHPSHNSMCAPLTDHSLGESLCTPPTDLSLGSSDSLN